MKTLHSTAGLVVATMVLTVPAFAYSPKWLQCDGQLVVTGGQDAGTKPARDYYIYDDDNKNLFTYLQAKGSQAIEPVTVYNADEIRWAMHGGGINDAHWEGRIDRKTLGLRLDYSESGSARTWTEQCKPTNPISGAVSADASSSGAKSGQ